ncbi:MAG: hypothetical protein RLZZ67_680 [Candidatus Parcubacteria bacterium]|jgi:hypothetical protein
MSSTPAPVPAPETTVTATAKQSALARFGFPLLGLLTVLVFINIVQNTSINGNVVKVNNNIVALDTNLSETTKIAKAGNKTAAEALALAKEAVAAVEKVAKTVDDSKTAMVGEGDKNRAAVSQVADHLGTLVTKAKDGYTKTQGDVAELQKSLAASAKQSSDASAAQVTQAAQIASKLDEIKTQLAGIKAPQQVMAVTPQQVVVDPTATAAPVPAPAVSTTVGLSGTQVGGTSGGASRTKTEWVSHETAANESSIEFSAQKAREGKIIVQMNGRVIMTQRFGGWSNRRESVSAIPRSGNYTVFKDAKTVTFRLDDQNPDKKLVIKEKMD